jgi:SAM-dependent methyltransferase
MGKSENPPPLRFEQDFSVEPRGSRQVLRGTLRVDGPMIFVPQLRVRVSNDSGKAFESNSVDTAYMSWLPRGSYRVEIALPGALGHGKFRVALEAFHRQAMTDVSAATFSGEFTAGPQAAGVDEPLQWTFESVPPTQSIHSLSWKKGHSDWFFRHFDHAAETIISYLLGNSPLLRGRVLDVGCGDGITDLGVALRAGCSELVGLEPFKQYERLPAILAENNIPADIMPPNLRFIAEDANFLPFPDDSFDVVLSWGSMEHIAGGYLQALREVKRVLRHDGLFMAAPGLFYSNIGHHLDEFSKEPFFHLKKSREEIRRMVLETPPKYIDRSGEFASNEQYWQWFTELNPITVARFEQELRALEFRPWRIALRTDHLVEYTPEIEHYPIQDLANIELYSSWISRKKVRG